MKTTSKSKKLIGFIASAAMTVSLLPANIAFADDMQYNTWTEAAAAAESGKDYEYDESGTYIVYSAKGLAYAACLVNGTVDNKEIEGDGLVKYSNINITLNNNIDLSKANVSGYGEGSNNSWTPIGSLDNKYTGTFDGGGNCIFNLYIDTSSSYAGLFGYVGTTGVIRNTTISSGEISNNYSNSSNYVAGLAGYNSGEISECINKCNIYNIGDNSYAGGITGENHGIITSCENHGSITSKGNAGGISGSNNPGVITDSKNSGRIEGNQSGGITGFNNIGSTDSKSTIDGCYNYGEVAGINNENDLVGGIVGQSSGGNNKAIIKNCVNIGKIINSIEYYAAGIAGFIADTDIVNCANNGSVDGFYAAGIAGAIYLECNVINCVNFAKISGTKSGSISCLCAGNIEECYYLNNSADIAVYSGIGKEKCNSFSGSSDIKYTIDNGGTDLVTKLNENVEEHKEEGYELWSSSNGSLMLGDYTVIETTPTPDTGVTTTAIAVAENPAAAQMLESENIKVYDGISGGYEYGNTISTTFKTTQAISDTSSDYGVWTVDLSQGNSYVKSSIGAEGAIVEDIGDVQNNKGAIYATEQTDRKNYTLYFDKSQTTILSGDGGVVFGLVIDGLYAPDATATFEFKETVPDGATELTTDNSIFKADGESYQHNDSVLHKNAS